MKKLLKVLVMLLVLCFGIVGLCMSLCGGIFTLSALFNEPDVLTISLPSLALGLVVLRQCFVYVSAAGLFDKKQESDNQS